MALSWPPRFGRRKRVPSISLSDISAPTPQEWSALVSQSLKRLPLSSPLHVLPLAMGALDYQTWQHRITFVMERYHQKDKSLDSDHLFEKAFTTLESLCVGEEAEDSLYAFRSTFLRDQEVSLEDEPDPSHLEDHASASLLKSAEPIDGLGELDRHFKFPIPPTFPKPLRGHLSLPNMGTLADVTDRANNTPRNSSSRRGTTRSPPKPKMNVSTPKDRGYKENPPPPGFVHPFKAMVEGIPETPRYLTPTNSSRSQAGTRKQGQGWPGSSTPTTSPTPSSTLKGPRWVASAARRVGLSRIPGDTPKSKTALPHGHQNVKTDGKTVEQNHTSIRASATPSKVSPETLDKPSPTDKPLPSPPVVQVVLPDSTPIPPPRTLLDASDKPLRRTPPGSSGICEEWPVLSPYKPTTSNASQDVARIDKPLRAIAPCLEVHERNPTRMGISAGRAVTDPTNLAKESDLKVARKPLPTTASVHFSEGNAQDLKEEPNSPHVIPTSDNHLAAPHPNFALSVPSAEPTGTSLLDTLLARDETPTSAPTSATAIEKRSLIPRPAGTPDVRAPLFQDDVPTIDQEDMSPSAAAVEKFSSIPRPTRDLSMRARVFEDDLLSANSKVTCAAEPTAGKQNSVPMRSSLRTRSTAMTSSQTQSKVRRTLDTRASPPRASNQPPAKFITTIPRPGSRTGSRASSSQGSCFGALRQRSSKASLGGTECSSTSAEVIAVKEPKNDGHRRSSIPIFRRVVRRTEDGNDSEADIKVEKKPKGKDAKLYEDSHEGDVDTEASKGKLHCTITDSEDGFTPKSEDKEVKSGLGQLKRLSSRHQGHGPTLRVSPSAERIIMGMEKGPGHPPTSPRARAGSSPFPARTSSRTPVSDYTTKARSKLVESPVTQEDLAVKTSEDDIKNVNSRIDTLQDLRNKILEGAKNGAGPEDERKLVDTSDFKAFYKSLNNPELADKFKEKHLREDQEKWSRKLEEYEEQKRVSQGSFSKKGKLFDMFKKRTTGQSDAGAPSSVPSKGKRVSVTRDGSPYPATNSSLKSKAPLPIPTARPHVPNTRPTTPPLKTSEQDRDLKTANALVMHLLEDARVAPNSPRKEGLLQLGRLMVDVLTEARHAAQHAEKAKVEAQRAELAYMQTHASVQAAVQLLEKYDSKTRWLDPNYKKPE